MAAEVLGRAWEAAALGCVAVPAGGGRVHVEPVVPVVLDGTVRLLLPFDRTELAGLLADVGWATLATWDSRLALKGWQPIAARVGVDVIDDREGRWVDEGWLSPLLLAHPPSRVRLDTPLLRREHWWYVPRWVVTVTSVERVWPIGRRDGPTTALLAWADAGGVDADVVEVEDWDDDPLALRSRSGRVLGDRAAATLLACDVRTPDLDQMESLMVRGSVRDGALHAEERAGRAEIGRPPSLWSRFAADRALERACRRALGEG